MPSAPRPARLNKPSASTGAPAAEPLGPSDAAPVVSVEAFLLRRVAMEQKRTSSSYSLRSERAAHRAEHATHSPSESMSAWERGVHELMKEMRATALRRAQIPELVAAAVKLAQSDEDDDAGGLASEIVIVAACSLAQRIAAALAHLPVAIPRFAVGRGVDLYWTAADGARLNVAVPPGAGELFEFYGDTRQGETFGGKIRSDGSIDFLARWLSERTGSRTG
jgi:hypothetical protein